VRVYNGKDLATHTFDPNGASFLAEWFPYALGFNVGAHVAVADTTGSGSGENITGSSIGNPDGEVESGQAIANHKVRVSIRTETEARTNRPSGPDSA
jgi:hypothetical protein